MKKLICIILSIIMILTAAAPSIYAQENAEGTDIPLIYVYGQGSKLVVRNDDGTSRQVYPLSVSADEIKQVAKDNLGIFAKAVLTQKWDEFADLLYELASEYFAEIKLDENAEAPNGSD